MNPKNYRIMRTRARTYPAIFVTDISRLGVAYLTHVIDRYIHRWLDYS